MKVTTFLGISSSSTTDTKIVTSMILGSHLLLPLRLVLQLVLLLQYNY